MKNGTWLRSWASSVADVLDDLGRDDAAMGTCLAVDEFLPMLRFDAIRRQMAMNAPSVTRVTASRGVAVPVTDTGVFLRAVRG
jgi:hypothetical protein